MFTKLLDKQIDCPQNVHTNKLNFNQLQIQSIKIIPTFRVLTSNKKTYWIVLPRNTDDVTEEAELYITVTKNIFVKYWKSTK